MKIFNNLTRISYFLVISLFLVAGLFSIPKAEAANTITIDSAVITSSNTVLVTVTDGGGLDLLGTNTSKWHIDVNGGGSSPLDPTSAIVTDGVFPGQTITLTFSGTPFANKASAYSAATGLFADDVAVVDTIANTNVVIGHAASIQITDGQAPSVTSISVAAGTGTGGTIKLGDTPTVTIVMNEPVAAFTNGDVTMANGSIGALSSGDQITFTGTFTPDAIDDNTNTASVSTDFTDTAGNTASAGATSANYVIDTIAPAITTPGTVTLTGDVGGDLKASIGDTITYAAGTATAPDTDIWTVDLSAYGLSATAAPGAYQIVADNDTGAFTANERITDNGGNTIAPSAATIVGGFNIDNVAPTFSVTSVSPVNGNTAKIGGHVIVTVTAGGNEIGLVGSGAQTVNGVTPVFTDLLDGTYTFDYTVVQGNTDIIDATDALPVGITLMDSAKNAGTPITTIAQGSAPGIDAHAPSSPANIAISSNNASTTLAKTGDVVTVTTAVEANSTLTGTIDGKAAVGNVVGTVGTLTRTMDGSETENALTFSFVSTDAAGNPGAAETAVKGTGSGTSVTYDKTAPSSPANIAISSNNASTTLAKTGDVVTVTTAVEANSTLTGTIDGKAAVGNVVGTVGTLTRTMDGSETENALTFSFVSTDAAGNPGAAETAVKGAGVGTSVVADFTAPTVSVIGAFAATGGTPVAGTINASNTGFTVKFTSPATNYLGTAHLYVGGVLLGTDVTISVADGSTEYTLTGDATSITDLGVDGAKALTVKIIDAAGNASVASGADNITLDRVAPTIASVTSNATVAGTRKIGETIIFTATPTIAEAGLTLSPATYNGRALAPGWTSADAGITYTATYTVTDGDTDHLVTPLQLTGVTATDTAGNTGASADGADVAKTIDAHTPTFAVTSVSPLSGTTAKVGDSIVVTVHAGSNETGLLASGGQTVNGQAAMFAETSGGDYTITYTVGEGQSDIADSAALPVSITLRDAAGNIGTEVTSVIAGTAPGIDANTPAAPGAPDMTVGTDSGSSNSDNITSDSTPNFTVSCETGANVILYDNVTPVGSGTCSGGTVTITASTLADGVHATLNTKQTDLAGNISTASGNLSVTIDTVNPVAYAGADAGEKTALFTHTDPTATDVGGSGVDITAWTKLSGLGTITFSSAATTNPGNISVTAGSYDNYVARLTVTDLAGNSHTDDFTFSWLPATGLVATSYSPANAATGIAVTAGTATATFNSNITLLDATKVTIKKDSDNSSVAGVAASVSGGNGTSAILNIPFIGLANSTTYRINIAQSAVRDASGTTNAATVSYFTTAAAQGNGTLTVSQIGTVANPSGSVGAATADATFANGFAWTFNITVPTTETNLKLKFSDFVNGSNSITADNIRVCSAQSSNKTCTSEGESSTDFTSLTAANTYQATALALTGDLDPATEGRQVQVRVEMKVPVSTAGGSYSGSYGVQSLVP